MHGKTQIGFKESQPEYKDFQAETGVSLQSGDYFRFQVKVDKSAYVYIVFQDCAGEFYSMKKGLVPGGQAFSLPGENNWFQTDMNTGAQQLFVLASKKQIKDFEKKVDALRKEDIFEIYRLFSRATIQLFRFSHK
jgi:hypothetical protein